MLSTHPSFLSLLLYYFARNLLASPVFPFCLSFTFASPPYSLPPIICLFILLSCPRADPFLYHPSSMSVYRPFTLTVSHSTAYHPGFSSPCLPRLSLQSSLLSSSQVLHRIPYLCPPHIHNLSLYDSDIGCLLFSVHNVYYVWALDQTLADVWMSLLSISLSCSWFGFPLYSSVCPAQDHCGLCVSISNISHYISEQARDNFFASFPLLPRPFDPPPLFPPTERLLLFLRPTSRPVPWCPFILPLTAVSAGGHFKDFVPISRWLAMIAHAYKVGIFREFYILTIPIQRWAP